MADKETIALYDARAADYAARIGKLKMGRDLRAFIALLPAGGRVLDLGCGAGTASVQMAAAGFDVDPVDGSAGMVAHARDQFGLPARQMTFDALDAVDHYDGVWANFSLTHAPHDALPGHLVAIARALRPGGTLHVGLKTGTGELRDSLGRYYALHSAASLRQQITDAGLTVIATREGTEIGFAGTNDPYVIMRAQRDG